jgi:hypothetical protein
MTHCGPSPSHPVVSQYVGGAEATAIPTALLPPASKGLAAWSFDD